MYLGKTRKKKKKSQDRWHRHFLVLGYYIFLLFFSFLICMGSKIPKNSKLHLLWSELLSEQVQCTTRCVNSDKGGQNCKISLNFHFLFILSRHLTKPRTFGTIVTIWYQLSQFRTIWYHLVQFGTIRYH